MLYSSSSSGMSRRSDLTKLMPYLCKLVWEWNGMEKMKSKKMYELWAQIIKWCEYLETLFWNHINCCVSLWYILSSFEIWDLLLMLFVWFSWLCVRWELFESIEIWWMCVSCWRKFCGYFENFMLINLESHLYGICDEDFAANFFLDCLFFLKICFCYQFQVQ